MKTVPILGFVLTLTSAAFAQRIDPQVAWQQFRDTNGPGWTAE